MNSASGRKLELGRIFRRGFALEGVNRARLLKAIGLPLALMIVCPIAAALTGFTSGPRGMLTLSYLMLPVIAALAIGVHRVVLMSPVEAFASGEGFSASARRLLQYLAAALCLLLAFQIVGGGVANIVLWAMSDSPPRVTRVWAIVAGGTVAALVLARFMLVLPAIAINVPQPVLSAWRVSQGYGIRIAFVFLAIPCGATALFKHLFPRGTTWPQYIALVVLAALLTVFAFAVVSFTCRALTAPEPPPTDPPA